MLFDMLNAQLPMWVSIRNSGILKRKAIVGEAKPGSACDIPTQT